MRINYLIAAAAIGLAGPAMAADKAGPIVTAEPTLAIVSSDRTPWTGCYLDAGAGREIIVNNDSLGIGSLQGTTISLGAGCDLQVREHIVVGLTARYGFSFDNSTASAGLKLKADRPWFAGARAGVLMNPSTLVYGVVGMSGLVYHTGGFTDSSKGVALGAGIETQVLGRRWTLGLEYLWSDVEGDANAHSMRASVRHRF